MIVGKMIEQVKVANGLVAQDANGGKTSNYFTLKNYQHLCLVLSLGNLAGNTTLSVIQSKDTGGATTKILGLDRYFRMTGTTNETITEVTGIAGTIGMTAGMSSGLLILEIDASDLDAANDYDCVAVNFSDPSASDYVAVVGVLGGTRYAASQPGNVLS